MSLAARGHHVTCVDLSEDYLDAARRRAAEHGVTVDAVRPARAAPRRFPRPPVRLDLLRPSSTQSAWGARRTLPSAAVREAWAAVRDQVLDAGLVLATHLRTPRRRASG